MMLDRLRDALVVMSIVGLGCDDGMIAGKSEAKWVAQIRAASPEMRDALLAQLVQARPPPVGLFERLVQGGEADLVQLGLTGLADLGPLAQPSVGLVLAELDRDRASRASVLATLGQIDVRGQSAARVRDLLGQEKCQLSAAIALSLIAPGEHEGIAVLRKAIREGNDAATRWAALSALQRHGPGGADALPDLCDVIQRSGDRALAREAVVCIRRIGRSDAMVTNAIAAAAASPDIRVSAEALLAIGILGIDDLPAKDVLARCRATDDQYAVLLAAAFLWVQRVDRDFARGVIESSVRSSERWLRIKTLAVLEELGSAAAAFVPAVAEVGHSAHADVTGAAALAIRRMSESSEEVRPLVTRALQRGHFARSLEVARLADAEGDK